MVYYISYNYEETSYILEGNNIISEIHSGLNNYQIDYFYDSSGNIIGFTYNNSKYLYLKNIQNDIIGIVDENNEVIVKSKSNRPDEVHYIFAQTAKDAKPSRDILEDKRVNMTT